jgi:hypothetical protein
MSYQRFKTAAFGSAHASLATVGYALYNADGSLNTARTTGGVAERPAGSGTYAAVVTFPASFQGELRWDSGETTPVFASEEINPGRDEFTDAAISSRSTYAGGAVASVTAPVTVGTVNDKAGYLLAAAGLDAITVETGVNARQALSPILAASAGTLAGAGTGTIVIKGGNVATTRITATTDSLGNRSAIALSLPA